MESILKARKSIFFILVIFLIFNSIPLQVRPKSAMALMLSDKLVFYPLVAGIILDCYGFYRFKSKIFSVLDKRILLPLGIFIGIYLLVSSVSLAHGLITFPFYNEVINGSTVGLEHTLSAFNFIKSKGINISLKTFMILWLIVRYVKILLLSTILTYGTSFMLLNWMYERPKEYINLLVKGTIVAIIILVVYSFIEVFYLAHNEWAEKLLTIINPYIHAVRVNGYWWPPLLWKNQLRSVFAEPSFFGIYASFAMPLAWLAFIKQTKRVNKYGLGLLILAYTFILFLTNARTALVLFLGDIVLLVILTLYKRSKIIIRHTLTIIVITIIAFAGATGFISYANIPLFGGNPQTESSVKANNSHGKPQGKSQVKPQSKPQNKPQSKPQNKPQGSIQKKPSTVEKYVNSNLLSLKSSNQRSNGSRFTVLKADLEVGIEHPLLGVGMGLRSPYVSKKISNYPNINNELKGWIERGKKYGILDAGAPQMGHYSVTFCETGFIGLLLFLSLPLTVLFRSLTLLFNSNSQMEVYFMLISFMGVLASGIGDSLNITYCYWLMLAIVSSIYFNVINKKDIS